MNTIPFDLNAWKAGAIAVREDRNLTAEFVAEGKHSFTYKVEGNSSLAFSQTGLSYDFTKSIFLDNCAKGLWRLIQQDLVKDEESKKTVPFDMERWKAGELAYSTINKITALFVCETEKSFHYKLEGDTPEPFSKYCKVFEYGKALFLEACTKGQWEMKSITAKSAPQDKEIADGWLSVDNGKMPDEIKRAREGEWEFRWRSKLTGEMRQEIGDCDAIDHSCNWARMDSVRLLNRPVQQDKARPRVIEKLKPRTIVIDDDLSNVMPITLAEIRARTPRPEPIREIGQKEILRIAGEAMEGKRYCDARWLDVDVMRLMK